MQADVDASGLDAIDVRDPDETCRATRFHHQSIEHPALLRRARRQPEHPLTELEDAALVQSLPGACHRRFLAFVAVRLQQVVEARRVLVGENVVRDE